MLIRSSLPVLLVLTLSACGGGGGGGDGGGGAGPVAGAPAPAPVPAVPAPPPVTAPAPAPTTSAPPPTPAPTPVLPPLTFVSSNPVSGANAVARTASVSATFNGDLLPASLTAANVSLLAPGGDALPATLSSAGPELRVTPKAALPGDTTYTVRVGGGVSGISASGLAAPASVTFTTAPQAWSSLRTDFGTTQAIPNYPAAPGLVSDQAGNVISTWSGADITNMIYASRFNAATGNWSAPGAIYVAKSQNYVYKGPLLGGADGDACQYFIEGDTYPLADVRQPQLRSLCFDHVTAAWKAPSDITVLPAGHYIDKYAMVLDSENRLTLVLVNSTLSGGAAVYASSFDRVASTWSAPQRIDLPVAGKTIEALQAAADGAGNIAVSWVDGADTRKVMATRLDRPAAGWSPPVQLAQGLRPSDVGTLAVNKAGIVTVGWYQEGTPTYPGVRSFARFDPVTKNWLTRGFVADSFNNWTSPVQIVIDEAGFTTALWFELEAAYAARYDPATTMWSAPKRITTPGFSLFTAKEGPMAIDAAGNITVLVTDHYTVQAIRYRNSDGSWSGQTGIGKPEVDVEHTVAPVGLTIDPSGIATAAWHTITNTASTLVDRDVVVGNRYK